MLQKQFSTKYRGETIMNTINPLHIKQIQLMELLDIKETQIFGKPCELVALNEKYHTKYNIESLAYCAIENDETSENEYTLVSVTRRIGCAL